MTVKGRMKPETQLNRGFGNIRGAIEKDPSLKAELIELLKGEGIGLPEAPAPVVAPAPVDFTPDNAIVRDETIPEKSGPTLESELKIIGQMRKSVQNMLDEADKQWASTNDDGVRRISMNNQASARELMEVVDLAEEIAKQPGGRRLRKFGCRRSRRLTISGRYMLPDIKFRAHRYATDDPVMVARILHYMDNRNSTDEPIIELESTDIECIVDAGTGSFRGFVPGMLIEQMIADSEGTLKRARP